MEKKTIYYLFFKNIEILFMNKLVNYWLTNFNKSQLTVDLLFKSLCYKISLFYTSFKFV